MASVGAFEAKTHFSQLLERVGRGEEIPITRCGKAGAGAWCRPPADTTSRP
jgi:antitoxin (DNA-binding transcriptional repressor) of toxin-antitoxin stability system